MTQRNRTILAAVIVAAAIATLLVWKRQHAASNAPPASAPDQGATPTPTPTHTPATGSTGGATAPGSAAAPAARRPRLDAEARQQLLARLAEARAKRHGPPAPAATTGAPGGPAPALPPPVLDKTYVQAQVRELVPLLVECYEAAQDKDPKLAGKLVVEFTIGGEPEVGGLVESSEVLAEQSTITDAGMVECVRETMYGAELVAPEDGGQVTVRYPFEFRPGE